MNRATIRRVHGWWLVLLLSVVGVSANSTDFRLVEAVKEQDYEAVRALLKQRVDVNAPQPDGATALHWARLQGGLGSRDSTGRARLPRRVRCIASCP